ncbi:BrxA/BrxB family bacilliredoxin [Emticicia sp. CRIBPO]|jgi:putative YphP/YqiW family bacilliredoxin|uniref:BrxA/BrxB family bacilliredoxin n=1 Tax=Emticicia sp. CRIBPO TaxID=2683258 RepID=UPI0014126344|nr:BrxA/BrxB family bacilliredoxin [Emticicia sp. CRIBPO]NBA87626.1 BrxA/BrxB family bacilliredoxin [Emticicia sp. CRIBPO]
MYPPHLVAPMKEDLTKVGFEELLTPSDVDNFMADQKGTALVVINSVCGCAAGTCRPGVKLSLEKTENKPDRLLTVFAGVDTEATQRLREYIPIQPSSPAIALFKDGELIHFVERHHIEGRSAEIIGTHLAAVYDDVCVAE